MYLIYAVAKYGRNGRNADTFENVCAAAPALEEEIEFVKRGREPVHESIRGVSGDGEPLMKAAPLSTACAYPRRFADGVPAMKPVSHHRLPGGPKPAGCRKRQTPHERGHPRRVRRSQALANGVPAVKTKRMMVLPGDHAPVSPFP